MIFCSRLIPHLLIGFLLHLAKYKDFFLSASAFSSGLTSMFSGRLVRS
jgi:hypothetical protein